MITPYVDSVYAQAYFDTRLNVDAWEESSDDDRMRAIYTATRAIDRLNFIGRKTNALQEQKWPRDLPDGLAIIPEAIKVACCEITLALLDGVDPDLEEENLGAVTDAYATVRNTRDSSVRQDHIRAGIPSVEAWKYLKPYLNDGTAIKLVRS